MNQFLQFFINHWMLAIAFLVIVILIIFEELRGRIQGVARIQPQELVALINTEAPIIVDLRDSNAYLKSHIIGAINIPHTQLDANLDKLRKSGDKPIVLVCANGQTAPQEGVKLKKQGIENVSFLSGGLSAWQNAGLPLTRD